MINRRTLLESLALEPTTLSLGHASAFTSPTERTKFLFSLNTSTIRGQKLSLPEIIKLTAKTGYNGFEP
jgi:hypothetical protein